MIDATPLPVLGGNVSTSRAVRAAECLGRILWQESKMSAPRNARFWIWHVEGWVKLTLRPGDRREICEGGQTDEGYSCSAEVYEFDGQYVTAEYSSWGRDCDGRFESGTDVICHVDALKDNQAEDGTEIPNWEKVGSSQRDYSAEAMGY